MGAARRVEHRHTLSIGTPYQATNNPTYWEMIMPRRSLFTSGLVAGAISIGSTLAHSTALAGEFPRGTFEAKEAPYTVSFDGKGRFQVNQGGMLEVTGTYSVNHKVLTLTDTQGPWACSKEGERTGTYRWIYENAVLALSKVADKCEDRVKSLVSLAWKQEN